MTSLKERQRAARRARLEQEMAARQEHAARRRHRRNWSVSIALAAVVVAGLVVIIVTSSGGSPKKVTAAANANAGPATCKWTPNPNPSASPSPAASTPPNKDLIKTGMPPTTGIPHSGTRAMTLTTNLGTITVALNVAKAPCASESLAFLAGKKFYDNTSCGNLITQGPYVLMCGDPSGNGDGGPDYTYATENLPTNQRPNYQAGDVAMLNNGNGNGSQFMIIYKDTPVATSSTGTETPAIPSNFTIVGTVTSGMNIVQKVAAAGAKTVDKNGGAAPKLPITFQTVTVGPAS